MEFAREDAQEERRQQEALDLDPLPTEDLDREERGVVSCERERLCVSEVLGDM